MFIKLLKEIPQMFVIAAIIWGFVLILVIRNSRKIDSSFFAKHRSSLVAAFIALALTATDIWVFVEYIPTHFKKHPVTEVLLSPAELLADSSQNDMIHKPMVAIGKKDSAKQEKAPVIEEKGKTYLTNKASIRFFSHASEDIEATNHSVACSLNDKTGHLKFTGLIRGFQFENEMMQEHFNDKDYMNSEVYPKTSFNGEIQNIQSVNFTKDGDYPVTASGALTIHGVTKNITANGTVKIAGGKLTLKSIFNIKRADFGINTDEIAEQLEITVIAGFN